MWPYEKNIGKYEIVNQPSLDSSTKKKEMTSFSVVRRWCGGYLAFLNLSSLPLHDILSLIHLAL